MKGKLQILSVVAVVLLVISFVSVGIGTIGAKSSIESVVEDVMPAVVHIQYNGTRYGESWQGSGVIISEDGLVLTARHVCKSPGEFTVTLSDGRKFVTDKACVSREHDVGYLKIDAIDLPIAKFGDSNKMKLGSTLIAIGSPWGIEHFNSVTTGVLSASHRDCSEDAPSFGWGILFQSDVTSNPGNSGCPVFNTHGKIVGIIVGSYGPGHYAGVVYCIPSNVCRSFVTSVQLSFALHDVVIVETDEKVDALEKRFDAVENEIHNIEEWLDDFDCILSDVITRSGM